MVCKINFDYEILLSDENDSILSSNYSSDNESIGKKFILGDNILNVTPLEIISVRQLNDRKRNSSNESVNYYQPTNDMSYQSIPMDYHVYYDESRSNSVDESVTESECDLNSYFPLLQEKEFAYPLQPLKYKLPSVNRYQVIPSAHTIPNINSINQYCMKEKHRRLQAEIVGNTNKIKNETNNMKKLNNNDDDNNEKKKANESQKSSLIPQTQQTDDDENPIPPELLSNISIDLLTEFINGEKSINEIISKTQTKRRKRKKNKRHKIDNKYKEIKQFPIIYGQVDKLEDNEIINIKNGKPKSIKNQFFGENLTDISSIILQNDVRISVTMDTIDYNFINMSDNGLSTQLPIIVDNHQQESYNQENQTSNDEYQQPSSVLDSLSNNDRKESQSNIKNIPITCNEKIEITPCNLYIDEIIKSDQISNIIDRPNINKSQFDLQTSIYNLSDDCKDTRTSSTDSGYHDIDEIQPTITSSLNKIDEYTNQIQQSENIVSNHRNNNSHIKNDKNKTDISVNNFLDLSSFKFNFINESHLIPTNIDVCHDDIKTNDIDTHTVDHNNNTNHNKHITHVNDNDTMTLKRPCQIIDKSKHFNQIKDKINTNTTDQISSSDHHNNDAIVTESINIVSIIESTNLQKNIDDSDKCLSIISNIATQLHDGTDFDDCDIGRRKWNPFKIDYHSPDTAIDNEEEISQFLNFQWLNFCEKYTMYYHNLKML